LCRYAKVSGLQAFMVPVDCHYFTKIMSQNFKIGHCKLTGLY